VFRNGAAEALHVVINIDSKVSLTECYRWRCYAVVAWSASSRINLDFRGQREYVRLWLTQLTSSCINYATGSATAAGWPTGA